MIKEFIDLLQETDYFTDVLDVYIKRKENNEINYKQVGYFIFTQYKYLENNKFQHIPHYYFLYNNDVDKNDKVSLLLPVNEEPYCPNEELGFGYSSEGFYSWKRNILPCFFQNYAEGSLHVYLKESLLKQFSIDPSLDVNAYITFKILGIIGRNQIGRVKLVNHDEELHIPTEELEIDAQYLLNKADGAKLEVINHYFENFARYSGVSGVFPKVLGYVKEELKLNKEKFLHRRLSLPIGHYIIKFSGDTYNAITANEYFCMRLAKRFGIKTADCELSNNGSVLLVKRFDEEEDDVLAVEEACTLMGLDAVRKRGANSSYRQMIETLVDFVPEKNKINSLEKLIDLILLSVIIQNGDLHLKNVSLIYSDKKEVQVSPAYDVLTSTVHIPEDTLALPLLNKFKRTTWPTLKEFKKFINSLGMSSYYSLNEKLDKLREAIELTKKDIKHYINHNSEFKYKSLLRNLTNVWDTSIENFKKERLVFHITNNRLSKRNKI